EEIARIVAPADPLYIYGFQEEIAPLLFYLDRDAPVLQGRLGDAPPGFIIVPVGVWEIHQRDALDLEPVLTSDHGNPASYSSNAASRTPAGTETKSAKSTLGFDDSAAPS